ncbi:MAG TPA: hypothetical protein VFH73_26900 [Polyangia bacterium]|nr:hypothetical protein [Polyangia bacterium]
MGTAVDSGAQPPAGPTAKDAGGELATPGTTSDSGGDDASAPGTPSDSGDDAPAQEIPSELRADMPAQPAMDSRADMPAHAPTDSRVDMPAQLPTDVGGGDRGASRGDLPSPAGTCPDFAAGVVTFEPAGGPRQVTITMTNAAATQRGPLIFYWYATGSSPREAGRGLPLGAITAAGGIVVAPQDVANAGRFPWLSNLAQHDALFDEVVACAVRKTMIDPRRIHVVGFSAGALMTTHLSYARSKFLASVAAYSGGAAGQFQESDNKFPALIFTGGPNDIVVQDFFQSSQQWQTTLKNAGHFTLFCNHMGGHSIPLQLVAGVWQFFQDHPYGTVPSPYAGGNVPGSLAPPCVE